MSYLNMLKAQIDAGTYHVDSRALARKMLDVNQVLNMLNVEGCDILGKPKLGTGEGNED